MQLMAMQPPGHAHVTPRAERSLGSSAAWPTSSPYARCTTTWRSPATSRTSSPRPTTSSTPQQRDELAARSPHNVVRVDLPDGDDPYANAARLWSAWQAEGAVTRDDEPALWALVQDYTGPRRPRDDPQRLLRARAASTDYGPGRIRPHERTHPGPKEDRLSLTRATRTNLSPIFSLYDDPSDRRLGRAARRTSAREPDGAHGRRRRHRQPPVARDRPRRRSSAVTEALAPTPSC